MLFPVTVEGGDAGITVAFAKLSLAGGAAKAEVPTIIRARHTIAKVHLAGPRLFVSVRVGFIIFFIPCFFLNSVL